MAKGVKVDPNIIIWAIKSSGKNVELLSKKFTKIRDWIDVETENELTVNELNKLSKELRVPFGYFFLKEPPVEDVEILKFRTVNNEEHENPSRELIDTIKYMKKCQLFMKETKIDEGFSPLHFIESVSIKDDIFYVAKEIKKELDLPENWTLKRKNSFQILRSAISNLGILVMQNGVVGSNNKRNLDISEFRAFVLVDQYSPLIFLNAKDSINGKIFSLCHELVHIWLGIDELYNDNYETNQIFNNYEIEVFCNKVAAEIILPFEILQGIYNTKITVYENIKYITSKYNVSDLVVCVRLKQSRIISSEDFNIVYNKLHEEMQENLSNRAASSSGGDFYNTQGSRIDPNFAYSVNNQAKEGKILYTEAYKLIGAKGKTFDNLIAHMEGR